MLPAGTFSRPSLADVMASCLAAIRGESNVLNLSKIDRAVVLVADGLGAHALRARSGHARFLSLRLTKQHTIDSGFPTTTAAGLGSLSTGLKPGQHGLVGYNVLDPASDRVFNHLSGWKGVPDPSSWQRGNTVFEQASRSGIPSYAVGPERYRDTSFTRAVLRGARYVAAKTIEKRIEAALEILAHGGRGILYVYVPELDVAAHAKGWQSDQWLTALEMFDAAASMLARSLRSREAGFITADHGIIDVQPDSHVLYDQVPELTDGVRHVGGDPRCLQLYVEADAATRLGEAWLATEGHRSWIATRDEAIEAGWFGPDVADSVRSRIGDVLVATRAQIAYYDSAPEHAASRGMIGQHGSFSPEEVKVPLIPIGDAE